MRYFSLFIFITFLIIGCKSASINQKINKKREGLWIEQYSIDSIQYKSVGKYKNGDPIKKWRYYLNGKIIIREKYKGNICKTTTFFENGKIQSKGHTKTTTNSIEIHWFYDGVWNFYNEKGKPTIIKKYNNGELISEVELNQ
jgi:hypothetical protein